MEGKAPTDRLEDVDEDCADDDLNDAGKNIQELQVRHHERNNVPRRTQINLIIEKAIWHLAKTITLA